MEALILKSNSVFRNTVAISFFVHLFFLYCVYFTFSAPGDNTQTMVVSFFGSILGKSDLTFRQVNKAKVSGGSLKPVFSKQDAVSVSPVINSSFGKPPPSKSEALFYAKQLNKFLVIQSKLEAKQAVSQNNFEPPKWEKIELKLKPE